MRRNFTLSLYAVSLFLFGRSLIAQFEGASIQVADGFEVTQVYAVPGDTQGSWVALCVDDQGRLIAGDQNGGLFRITLQGGAVASVLPIDIEIGYVNGLTFAFGSLYAVVAEDKYDGGGLYRIQDTDGDDQFDKVEYLRDFVAKGEHGPHSVVPGPHIEFKGYEDVPIECATSSLRLENGKIKVPTGPGIGVDIDPDFVKKYEVVKDV